MKLCSDIGRQRVTVGAMTEQKKGDDDEAEL